MSKQECRSLQFLFRYNPSILHAQPRHGPGVQPAGSARESLTVSVLGRQARGRTQALHSLVPCVQLQKEHAEPCSDGADPADEVAKQRAASLPGHCGSSWE